MSYKQALTLRSKIIGLLLRDARMAAGKSMKELGDVIGVSGGRIGTIERGSRSPSLPELEMLAYFLDIPFDHFWQDEIVSDNPHISSQIDPDRELTQRHRTIGAILRQARNERNLSQKELGQRTTISSSRIRRYENGDTPVPIPELEMLADHLGYQLKDFIANSGVIGQWISQQREIEEFLKLPKSVRHFVANKNNRSYLAMAQNLSGMSLEKIRNLAEGLKDLSL